MTHQSDSPRLGRLWIAFGLLLVLAAAFVLVTGRSLPPTVASHFGPSGVADGFSLRSNYLALMLVCTVVLPAVIVLLASLSVGSSTNIPNREYWLAPERRTETRRALQTHAIRLGAMIAVFICFAHWLTVEAQTREPQHLPLPLFIGGLVVLLAATLAWCVMLFRRFALPK